MADVGASVPNVSDVAPHRTSNTGSRHIVVIRTAGAVPREAIDLAGRSGVHRRAVPVRAGRSPPVQGWCAAARTEGGDRRDYRWGCSSGPGTARPNCHPDLRAPWSATRLPARENSFGAETTQGDYDNEPFLVRQRRIVGARFALRLVTRWRTVEQCLTVRHHGRIHARRVGSVLEAITGYGDESSGFTLFLFHPPIVMDCRLEPRFRVHQ